MKTISLSQAFRVRNFDIRCPLSRWSVSVDRFKRRLLSTTTLVIALSVNAAHAATDVDRAVWAGNAAYHIATDGHWEIVSFLEKTLATQADAKSGAAQWINEADAIKFRSIRARKKCGVSSSSD